MKKFLYPVRWIGTNYPGANVNYQSIKSYDEIKKSLYWELFTCNRQRAFGYTTRNNDIGESWIGLLVDITRSQIDVIYKDDCYSLRDESSQQLISRRHTEYDYNYHSRDMDSNGEQTIRKIKLNSRPDSRVVVKPHLTQASRGMYSYREALGYLKFAGIVLKRQLNRWNNSTFEQERIDTAKQWAIEFDIPFLGKIGDFKPSRYFGL